MNWFPTGVTDLEPFSLERDVVKELIGTFKACEGREPSPKFFSDIENSIACYRAHSQLKKDCLPGKVRKKLDGITKQAQKLLDSLYDLDGLSSELLREEADLGDMRRRLMGFVIAVGRAEQKTDDFPNNRPPDYPERILAIDVRRALEKQDFRCTTSKVGLFHNVLGVIVRAATGNSDLSGEVERLVKIALTDPTPTQILPDRS